MFMVIKIEYGNQTEVVKSSVMRGVLHPQLSNFIEGFFAQDEQYRWGKMYILKGKEQKIIRQFGIA